MLSPIGLDVPLLIVPFMLGAPEVIAYPLRPSLAFIRTTLLIDSIHGARVRLPKNLFMLSVLFLLLNPNFANGSLMRLLAM